MRYVDEYDSLKALPTKPHGMAAGWEATLSLSTRMVVSPLVWMANPEISHSSRGALFSALARFAWNLDLILSNFAIEPGPVNAEYSRGLLFITLSAFKRLFND